MVGCERYDVKSVSTWESIRAGGATTLTHVAHLSAHFEELVCTGFSGVGLLDSCCRWLSLSHFILDGREHAKRRVSALSIVKDLQVLEDGVGKFHACLPSPSIE